MRAAAVRWGVFAVYLAALAWIVFAPGDDAERATGIVALVAHTIEAWGVPFELGYGVLEFTANIALFVPFGVLLSLSAPHWHPWLVIATGLASSCLIELVQTGLPTRVASPTDLLANTVGTAVGVGLFLAWERLRRRPRAASRPRSTRLSATGGSSG
ncbi:VanZ family protein [Microterricola viridarii]|uniref:VanZ family protein n=1 Tax=Microterricola viridarii TaxID=412690 RepID=UPI0015603A85|nr:VanZ family protein [Microterricola viridarii]